MRIALLTNNYKPFIGGVPISVERLANALRARGNEVYVFAPTYDNQVEEEGVIRSQSFRMKIAGAAIPNPLDPKILREMQRLKIDVIHVHHPALMGNVALYLKQKLQIPVVFTYHTMYEEYLHYINPVKKTGTTTKKLLNNYLVNFSNHCDMVIAPTPMIADYLEEKDIQTQVSVIPTGLQPDSFSCDKDNVQQIREKYASNVDYVFVSVQRLAEEKNIDFQLRGMQLIKKKLAAANRTCRLLIIGEGPDRCKLQGRIDELQLHEEVVLVGNVKNECIRDFQTLGDAFLFSSLSETQGIVLLEAMAAGNPVIAVSANGVNDLVVSGENGYITEENIEEWSDRAVECVLYPELAAHLSAGALATASNYRESRIAKEAEEAYAQAILNYYKHQLTVQIRESVIY